jgi:hypothetical protein
MFTKQHNERMSNALTIGAPGHFKGLGMSSSARNINAASGISGAFEASSSGRRFCCPAESPPAVGISALRCSALLCSAPGHAAPRDVTAAQLAAPPLSFAHIYPSRFSHCPENSSTASLSSLLTSTHHGKHSSHFLTQFANRKIQKLTTFSRPPSRPPRSASPSP